MKKSTSIIFTFILITLFFFWKQGFQMFDFSSRDEEAVTVAPLPVPESVKQSITPVVIEKQKVIPVESIFQEVPFTSQAPTGNWSELVFQNACEEAVLLMASKWVRREIFGGASEREAEIRLITKEEEKYFPKNAYDISTEDMLFLAKKLYPEMSISLVHDVTKEDVRDALLNGNIVIVSANGQKLKNPNFTLPGPLYHALLIRGYDHITDEFITNDPGTRKGDGYRYKGAIIFDAMQDYATGYHGELFPHKKMMLVIQR